MKGKQELVPLQPPTGAWTRVEDYLGALARRRAARRRHEPGPRTQPEDPKLSLSTLPFLALLIALAVLTVGIAVAAWPGRSHEPPRAEPAREIGTAPPGWLDG